MFDTNLRGTILLSSGDLNIVKDVTIRGPGEGKLSISGGKRGYIVHVLLGTTVTISGLTFKNSIISSRFFGDQMPVDAFIHNQGMLTLSNSTVSGNTADFGGSGIDNFGTLTLTNSTVLDNAATGISNFGTLILTNSTVSDNTDGGIENLNGTLTLTNSTVSGNTSSADRGNGVGGGGIDNSGKLTLINSTVSGNTSTGGGGIENENDGTVMLINSTVSGNTSTGGGGIDNSGKLTLINSTVSGNTSTGPNSVGGGIFIQSSFDASGTTFIAQVDLAFSTIYGNTAHVGSDIAIADLATDSNGNSKPSSKQYSKVSIRNSIVTSDPVHAGPDMVGMLTSNGYNLFQDNSGATFDSATSKQHGTDRTLSVNDLSNLFAAPVGLRNNGGPTRTYALGPSSPALDQIPLQYCQVKGILNSRSGMYTDQRGMKRPDGNEQLCDIGAYEATD